MAVLLPQPRLPRRAVPKLIDYGVDQKGGMGGAYQRLNRLGNRFSLDIEYPRLKPEPDGRILAAAIRQAKTEGALFPIPQPGLEIGNPGAPVVNGADQQGGVIQLRGFSPNYVVRAGQFFSIIHGGRRYLMSANYEQDWPTNASGQLALPIHPMLRFKPANGAICEFAKPYIEGPVSGSSADVELTIARSQIPLFTITERK